MRQTQEKQETGKKRKQKKRQRGKSTEEGNLRASAGIAPGDDEDLALDFPRHFDEKSWGPVFQKFCR